MRLGQIGVRLRTVGRIRAEDALERAHGGHRVLALERQTPELGFGVRVEGIDRHQPAIGILGACRVAERRDELGQLTR